MPISCKLCEERVAESSDSLVLCAQHGGMVHLGCCIHNCSWDKEPCEHAKSIYDKVMLNKSL
ncbi:MAG: hypothetical protein ABIC91_00820 [Nanoarchaeota archaeon]|nr:hypothetical protein [Nanoarchaeota archaeon]MBU1029914.1 hypothetical protein [Nanoarchaeota archaeon]MBU1850524.1 hypothetical protein [Nanoarchaeota archaeon]